MSLSADPIQAFDVPMDRQFYDELVRRQPRFRKAFEHVIPAGTGYGFRVRPGQSWRFVVLERSVAHDVFIMSTEDPTERYSVGSQLCIEGSAISALTRLWGTPPRTRPLCTVLADTLRGPAGTQPGLHHMCHGGHCNPHEWVELIGVHPRTCEDNLRAALAMLGHSQRRLGENINIGWKTWVDPETGFIDWAPSSAEPGDYIEFYAEIALDVAVSLCPSGEGARGDDTSLSIVPTYPSLLEVYDTGVTPLRWPYEHLERPFSRATAVSDVAN